MFKKLGIGKALFIYISVIAGIVLLVSSIFFLTSQKAMDELTHASTNGTSRLAMQNSLIKSMALIHSNILPLAAETDPDSREIRIELTKGFVSEFQTLVSKCAANCDSIVGDFEKYEKEWERIAHLFGKNETATATAGILQNLNPLAESIFDKLDKAATAANAATTEDLSQARTSADKTKNILLVLIGGLVFGILAVGFIFQKKLVNSLQVVVGRVHGSVNNTASQTEEISSSTETLSSASTRQAASIEETVASLEEISSMIKLNAENAKMAATLSVESTHAATEGGKEITILIAAMKEIHASSKRIEEIIAVIDDIAFQTNLLALNAAVEAARAGEQGKGFAVVAEAVRSLAQRSAEAAKEIGGIIQTSVEQTEKGTKVADNSGAALTKIIQSIQKVSELNNEISGASQEQSQGISQLGMAMSDIDQATQTNAAVAEALSNNSQAMFHEAQELLHATKDLQTLLRGEKAAHKLESEEAPSVREPSELKKAS